MARLPPSLLLASCPLVPPSLYRAATSFSGFQVQLVSGASPLAYWLSSYLWDAILFFMLTVLVMLAFAAYGADASKVYTYTYTIY